MLSAEITLELGLRRVLYGQSSACDLIFRFMCLAISLNLAFVVWVRPEYHHKHGRRQMYCASRRQFMTDLFLSSSRLQESIPRCDFYARLLHLCSLFQYSHLSSYLSPYLPSFVSFTPTFVFLRHQWCV